MPGKSDPVDNRLVSGRNQVQFSSIHPFQYSGFHMVQSASERHKIIYEAWLANKSMQKTALQFGVTRGRVRQIVQKHLQRLATAQAVLESREPLEVAVAQGKISPRLKATLMRGGYGRDFGFEDLVNRLRTNTLNPIEFRDFGPISLTTLRMLFLSQAENEALPAFGSQSALTWWLGRKKKPEDDNRSGSTQS